MRILTFSLSIFLWQSLAFAAEIPSPQNQPPSDDAYSGIPFDDTTPIKDFDPEKFLEENFDPVEVYADERPTHLEYGPTAEFSSLTEALQRIEGISESDAGQMAGEVLSLFEGLVHSGRESESKFKTRDEFNRAVIENKIFLETPAGRAELNFVDGVLFQRILHGDTELSIGFIPDEKVSENSKHERRIIGLQHLTAGHSRRDGQTGRDFLEVRYRRGRDGERVVSSIRLYQRHAKWTKGWWRDQALISLYRPSAADFWIAGIFWGGFQVGQVALMNHLTELAHHAPQSLNIGQLLWTGCFGAICGTFATTIRKFNQIGGKLESLVRNSLTTTIPFLVPYVLMDPRRSFDSLEKIAVFAFIEIPVFCFLGNISKVPLQKIIKERSDLQLSADSVFLGVKQANWEYQTLYNALVFPIRILFLKSNGGFQLKDTIGFNIGYNKIALPLLYPFLWQVQVAYSEKIGSKRARADRLEFEKSTVGASTGFLAGSLIDAFFIPQEVVKHWLWGDITPEPMKHLERFKKRFRLQRWAPLYHSGRMINWFGEVFDPAPPEEPLTEIPHRFARIAESEFPPAERAFISRPLKSAGSAAVTTFRKAKVLADAMTANGLSACTKGLRVLGIKMKAPFLRQLENYR